MAGYRLSIKRSAGRELEGVGSRAHRERIVTRICALAATPRPHGCEKLAGYHDRYRIRQGDYRIVYLIDDHRQEIAIFKIGHRREVYRGD